jgi:urea transporter
LHSQIKKQQNQVLLPSQKYRDISTGILSGVLASYSMVFFSKTRIFALLLLAISFFDPVAGLSGLIAVLAAIGLAWGMGFDRQQIVSGAYGFNALLIGLGLGSLFQFSPELLLVLLTGSIFSLFLTLFFEGLLTKYRLPFLTLPFLIVFWTMVLATRSYSGMEFSERGIYLYNYLFAIGGSDLVQVYSWFSETGLPQPWIVYFKSLSAILFQYHLFAGILVAAGLLIYSRIAFLLSLAGFFSAYYFYGFIGASFDELNYTFIGFNFILTAIALGGFFIVSSRISFLWVILLTPLTAILIAASTALLSSLQLAALSLPFNGVVLLFLYSLNRKERTNKGPERVGIQQFSPERNLYARLNSRKRYPKISGPDISLPFMGEWTVYQAHSGEYTHQDQWRHAWDFVITGSDGKDYKGDGTSLQHYYCYDKPVIAPADGWVEEIIDHIGDNTIGEVNLEMNWGNTIVLRHTDLLFSQISHLKKGSFRVQKATFVKRGEVLANCGNSGRSPMPHLHFQFQATPYVGSPTFDYPLSEYIIHQNREARLISSGCPAKEEVLSNIAPNECLKRAMNFVPGQQLNFEVSGNGKNPETVIWDVKTDIYNTPFLECRNTGSRAWFHNDGRQFSFTWFDGGRRSLLFAFYRGAYKISTGFYQNLIITDELPLNMAGTGPVKLLQDFVAPFLIFMQYPYSMRYEAMDDALSGDGITLQSETRIIRFGKSGRKTNTRLYFEQNRCVWFEINDGNTTTKAKLLSDKPQSL